MYYTKIKQQSQLKLTYYYHFFNIAQKSPIQFELPQFALTVQKVPMVAYIKI